MNVDAGADFARLLIRAAKGMAITSIWVACMAIPPITKAE
jgi:hypothetical protein